jgi:SAM-dependent methyltransferase
MTISYSDRFQPKAAVDSYDATEYAAAGYSAHIWRLQRPLVEKILANFQRTRTAPVKLLDFACGTGRVLACVEQFAQIAEGIDISENMVAVARTKCQRATLKVGNILSQPELLGKKYDVITCFRLLLNLEPAMRGRILRELRQAIAPDGRLLINIHGNTHSLRHPAIVWRRWRERTKKSDVMLNEISAVETEKLLQESGFKVVRKIGFGHVPPGIYRTPLRSAAFAMDGFLSGDKIWSQWSVDILFECSPG